MTNLHLIIQMPATVVARACLGNPVLGVVMVGIYYLAANCLLAMIEQLLFGENFLHWLDLIIAVLFIAYSGVVVWNCALLHEYDRRRDAAEKSSGGAE